MNSANTLLMLVRREVWENRSLWITPLVIMGVILLAAAFGGIHSNGSDSHFVFGPQPTDEELQGLLSKSADKREAIYGMTIATFTMMQLFTLGIVVFFYLLDSLLSERKDRSILFWKSLPISDTQVVASKLLTALVAAPIYVLLVSAATQLLFALVWSLRFGGTTLGQILMPWDGGVWLQVQAGFVTLVPAVLLWYLPIAGYLLLVSVWARRNAFLWAVLPPVAILMVEGLLLRSSSFADFLGHRFGGVFEIMDFHEANMVDTENALGIFVSHVGNVFTHHETWLSVLAAAAMFVAVVRIRRYRDDS
jgi:ABC-2 type transport system permease protein